MPEASRLQLMPSPPSWTLTGLSGKDAGDFLHRLTTVDVKRLQPGRGGPGFFLDPRGKIVAAFTLWQTGPGEYIFEVDAGTDGTWRKRLLDTIERYHFGEDLVVSEISESGKVECRWLLAEGPLPAALAGLEPGHTAAIDEEIRLCHQGAGTFGRPWITAWGRPARLAQWLQRTFPVTEALSPETLELWRILSLGPAVGREITDEVNPLEIGMRQGVAEQKGCYPGQEVLEKILALGAPARRLVLLEGTGAAPAPGATLFNQADPPAEVATLTSATVTAQGWVGLALARKLHARAGFEVSVPGHDTATIARVAPYEEHP